MPGEITSISLDSHLARGGAAAQSFARLWEHLWDQSHIASPLLDLCRLTFARMHGDAAEMAVPNPRVPYSDAETTLRQAVLEDRALGAPALPDGWRSVLLFAEYYWTDVQSIPDEIANEVKIQLGAPALVVLIEALGCIDGRIRTARCLRDLADHRLAAAKEAAHVH